MSNAPGTDLRRDISEETLDFLEEKGWKFNTEYKQGYAKDRISSSASMPYIKSVLDSYFGEDSKSKIKENYIAAYSEIEGTDAQEYVTIQEHLYVMYAKGDLTRDQFNDLMKRVIHDPHNVKFSKAEMKLILGGTVFQPMKPVYSRHGADGQVRYIKSSAFPLIPELTKGLEIDKLRRDMHNNQINRVAFKTAVKIGFPKDATEMWTETDQGYEYSPGITTETLSREGFRIQLEIPYKADKREIKIGTQEKKLLFNLIRALSVKGYNNEDINVSDLENKYNSEYKKLIFGGLRDLMDELDMFTEDDDKSVNNMIQVLRSRQPNLESLQKIMVENATKLNYAISYLEGMELENGDFKVPLWSSPGLGRIQPMLLAIVHSRINKLKMNGTSLVLGSEEGFYASGGASGIVYTDAWEGSLKYKNVVDDNGREAVYTQVLMPFKFKFKGQKLDINNYTKRVDGKLIIDYDKLPKDMLKAFGFRIPTQGHNSMAMMEIVGFLPESSGDLIIAPRDFTVQMGSDFDVDKLFVYQPYHTLKAESYPQFNRLAKEVYDSINIAKLSVEGKSMSHEVVEKLKFEETTYDYVNAVRELEQYLTEENVDMSLLEEFNNSFIKNGKIRRDNKGTNGTKNNIFDIHDLILSSTNSEIQSHNMRPLDYGLLDQAEITSLIDDETIDSYSAMAHNYQRDKYLQARSGKALVGSFSLDVIFHSLTQDMEQRPASLDKDGNAIPFRASLLGKEGNEFINQQKTITGKRTISEVIVAYQSVAVDNENLQLLGKLNINENTADFVRLAAMYGFEENHIQVYLMNPYVREMVNIMNQSESLLSGRSRNFESIASEILDNYVENRIEEEGKGLSDKDKGILRTKIINSIQQEFREFEERMQIGSLKDNMLAMREAIDNNSLAAGIHAMQKFMEFSDASAIIRDVQGYANADSAGLGTSILDVSNRANRVSSIQNRGYILENVS